MKRIILIFALAVSANLFAASPAATQAWVKYFSNTNISYRSSSFGNNDAWVDATGCVWKVSISDEFSSVYVRGRDVKPIWKDVVGPGVNTGFDGPGWYIDRAFGAPAIGGVAPIIKLSADPDVLEFVYYATVFDRNIEGQYSYSNLVHASKSVVTNMIGRIALTNDIQSVPHLDVQAFITNSPVYFADGDDSTNVPSIRMDAVNPGYTSFSFPTQPSYYLPNRFSLLELGNDYQVVAAPWLHIGRYMFAFSPTNIVFVGGPERRTLQDYLNACDPYVVGDLISAYLPTNGGGTVHGNLSVTGELSAGSLVNITNSDIRAKGFQVVNKVLDSDGLHSSNGFVTVNSATARSLMRSPRFHVNGSLEDVTYGGSPDVPDGSVKGYIDNWFANNSDMNDNPYIKLSDFLPNGNVFPLVDASVPSGSVSMYTLRPLKTLRISGFGSGGYMIGVEGSNFCACALLDFSSSPSAAYFSCYANDPVYRSNMSTPLVPTPGTPRLLVFTSRGDGVVWIHGVDYPSISISSYTGVE